MTKAIGLPSLVNWSGPVSIRGVSTLELGKRRNYLVRACEDRRYEMPVGAVDPCFGLTDREMVLLAPVVKEIKRRGFDPGDMISQELEEGEEGEEGE